mmetsp:Transcript_1021/g.1862  ORF Transcript_1021/g.1862 Transcript_1021/m.1862 type:complete len:500 (+) Transcript_1021:159-1658(+)|eukprot:CAMPEP_0182478048 /NCGR_PEP_ID=MMETSP1319-20130603/31905_1 /TAXON_ID=172717 /ORGANISM="Bolidomonas pacifica, Strain RCC208" /LENGTH=499 /DNA_ID=CAMNT_0024679343 /DNA_START=74 /DNA_END=1573 /DNA_ORIENTATION=+
MPTLDAKLKAAESGMGMTLQLLAIGVFLTIWGPFFSAGSSFLAFILSLAASFSSGQGCFGGGTSTGEDWSEPKRLHLKSSCCCHTPRMSSVSQLFAWTAMFAILNCIGASVQAAFLIGCSDNESDYWYYYDEPYHIYDDDFYHKDACQGYRYDFDLIIGIKPQNPPSSAMPFSYCTEYYVSEELGKIIVNEWIDEQELLESEDVNMYCEHFPASWTVPAASYADLLEGQTAQDETCVDREFMDLFLMSSLDSCDENEESNEECSLTDELIQNCTVEAVGAEGNCNECKAMTVSGVTGCYCHCDQDDSGETVATQEKVFSLTESDIMVIAQFVHYDYEDSLSYHSHYENKSRPDGCWVGEVSNIFGICSAVNAFFSFLLACFALRKRSQWLHLIFAIKRSEEGGGGVQMMNMAPTAPTPHSDNFGGGGAVHPINSAFQQPQGGGAMFMQLPNGQMGQIMMMPPASGFAAPAHTLRQTVLHPPPTLVATAVVAETDKRVEM